MKELTESILSLKDKILSLEQKVEASDYWVIGILLFLFIVQIGVNIWQSFTVYKLNRKVDSELKKNEFTYSEYKKIQFEIYSELYPVIVSAITKLSAITSIDANSTIPKRNKNFTAYIKAYRSLNKIATHKKFGLSKEFKEIYGRYDDKLSQLHTETLTTISALKHWGLDPTGYGHDWINSANPDDDFYDESHILAKKDYTENKLFIDALVGLREMRSNIDGYFSNFENT